MSDLIECKVCGNKYNKSLVRCPECGNPRSEEDVPMKVEEERKLRVLTEEGLQELIRNTEQNMAPQIPARAPFIVQSVRRSEGALKMEEEELKLQQRRDKLIQDRAKKQEEIQKKARLKRENELKLPSQRENQNALKEEFPIRRTKEIQDILKMYLRSSKEIKKNTDAEDKFKQLISDPDRVDLLNRLYPDLTDIFNQKSDVDDRLSYLYLKLSRDLEEERTKTAHHWIDVELAGKPAERRTDHNPELIEYGIFLIRAIQTIQPLLQLEVNTDNNEVWTSEGLIPLHLDDSKERKLPSITLQEWRNNILENNQIELANNILNIKTNHGFKLYYASHESKGSYEYDEETQTVRSSVLEDCYWLLCHVMEVCRLLGLDSDMVEVYQAFYLVSKWRKDLPSLLKDMKAAYVNLFYRKFHENTQQKWFRQLRSRYVELEAHLAHGYMFGYKVEQEAENELNIMRVSLDLGYPHYYINSEEFAIWLSGGTGILEYYLNWLTQAEINFYYYGLEGDKKALAGTPAKIYEMFRLFLSGMPTTLQFAIPKKAADVIECPSRQELFNAHEGEKGQRLVLYYYYNHVRDLIGDYIPALGKGMDEAEEQNTELKQHKLDIWEIERMQRDADTKFYEIAFLLMQIKIDYDILISISKQQLLEGAIRTLGIRIVNLRSKVDNINGDFKDKDLDPRQLILLFRQVASWCGEYEFRLRRLKACLAIAIPLTDPDNFEILTEEDRKVLAKDSSKMDTGRNKRFLYRVGKALIQQRKQADQLIEQSRNDIRKAQIDKVDKKQMEQLLQQNTINIKKAQMDNVLIAVGQARHIDEAMLDVDAKWTRNEAYAIVTDGIDLAKEILTVLNEHKSKYQLVLAAYEYLKKNSELEGSELKAKLHYILSKFNQKILMRFQYQFQRLQKFASSPTTTEATEDYYQMQTFYSGLGSIQVELSIMNNIDLKEEFFLSLSALIITKDKRIAKSTIKQAAELFSAGDISFKIKTEDQIDNGQTEQSILSIQQFLDGTIFGSTESHWEQLENSILNEAPFKDLALRGKQVQEELARNHDTTIRTTVGESDEEEEDGDEDVVIRKKSSRRNQIAESDSDSSSDEIGKNKKTTKKKKEGESVQDNLDEDEEMITEGNDLFLRLEEEEEENKIPDEEMKYNDNNNKRKNITPDPVQVLNSKRARIDDIPQLEPDSNWTTSSSSWTDEKRTEIDSMRSYVFLASNKLTRQEVQALSEHDLRESYNHLKLQQQQMALQPKKSSTISLNSKQMNALNKLLKKPLK